MISKNICSNSFFYGFLIPSNYNTCDIGTFRYTKKKGSGIQFSYDEWYTIVHYMLSASFISDWKKYLEYANDIPKFIDMNINDNIVSFIKINTNIINNIYMQLEKRNRTIVRIEVTYEQRKGWYNIYIYAI